MRRRTIGGGERDRSSTPVASPPQGDGGLDQFVKTRERAEVSSYLSGYHANYIGCDGNFIVIVISEIIAVDYCN